MPKRTCDVDRVLDGPWKFFILYAFPVPLEILVSRAVRMFSNAPYVAESKILAPSAASCDKFGVSWIRAVYDSGGEYGILCRRRTILVVLDAVSD